MPKKKKDDTFVLTATPEMQRQAKIATKIYRFCKESDVELSASLEELLRMLQVPLVMQSILARFLEVKKIFSAEIDAFFHVCEK